MSTLEVSSVYGIAPNKSKFTYLLSEGLDIDGKAGSLCCVGDTFPGNTLHVVNTVNDIRATARCCGWRSDDPPDLMALRRQIPTETVSHFTFLFSGYIVFATGTGFLRWLMRPCMHNLEKSQYAEVVS